MSRLLALSITAFNFPRLDMMRVSCCGRELLVEMSCGFSNRGIAAEMDGRNLRCRQKSKASPEGVGPAIREQLKLPALLPPSRE